MHNNTTSNTGNGRWVVIVAFFMLVLVFLSSTIAISAWLSDGSVYLQNIFYSQKVCVYLEETDTEDGDESKFTNSYQMKIGEDISKDPKVIIPANNGDSWVFIQLEKSDNFDEYMQYEIDSCWTELGDDYPGIYYMKSYSSVEEQEFPVLSGNIVKIKSSVTKRMLSDMDIEPTLGITAYAIQQASIFEPQDAWIQLEQQNDAKTGRS